MQTKKSGRKNSVKKLFSTKNTTGTDFNPNITNSLTNFETKCKNLLKFY